MQFFLPTLQHGSQEPERKTVPLLLIVLALLFFLKLNYAAAQQVAKTTPAGTKCWVYTSNAYNTGTTTHPLLVVLHGGGEIGDDLTKLTTGTAHQMPAKLISMNQWPQARPFVVVSPQLKRDTSIPNVNDQEWPAAYVDEVVEYMKNNYRIDATKIYVTGISLGGAGAWDYAAAYPAKVAALVPISGKSDVAKACAVKNIPTWAFHGENDALVRPKFSIDMINAIKACQPVGVFSPRLNLLYSRAHEGWNEVYNLTNGYDVYTWMLQFKKNVTTNVKPYVHAGPDRTILLRTSAYHITGDYFDSDGTISTVKWTQTLGEALTLGGTNTPFLKLTNLKAGTFEFQLSVTDNKGAVSTDKVKLVIVSPATSPAVTNLVMMNGKTNADIGNITEGKVYNKTTLGTTEFNVRAEVSGTTGSVRFSVNADQHTRTVNTPGPYLLKKQTSAAEWVMDNGSYVICATPYPSSGGKGVPGTTLCYRVTFTQNTTTAASVMTGVEPIEIVSNDDDVSNATSTIESTDALSNVTAVEVYPNPVTDIIRVKGNFVHYNLVNLDGITTQSGQLASDGVISLSPQTPKGNYVLILRNANKSERKVKLVVQ